MRWGCGGRVTFRTKKKIRARKTLAAPTELAKKTAHSSASFVNVIKSGPEGTLKSNLEVFSESKILYILEIFPNRPSVRRPIGHSLFAGTNKAYYMPSKIHCVIFISLLYCRGKIIMIKTKNQIKRDTKNSIFRTQRIFDKKAEFKFLIYCRNLIVERSGE